MKKKNLIISGVIILAIGFYLMYQYRAQDVDINFDAWIYDNENDSYTESKVSVVGKQYHSVIRQDYFAIKLTIGDTMYPDPKITGIIPFLSRKKVVTETNFEPTNYIENSINNLYGYSSWNLTYFRWSDGYRSIGNMMITDNKDIQIALLGEKKKDEQGGFGQTTRYYVFPKTEEFGKDYHKYNKAKFPNFSK